MSGETPEAIAALLEEHLRTAEHLAILFLLRHGREREFTADAVRSELAMSLEDAIRVLEDLRTSKLVELRGDAVVPAFLYSPSEPDSELAVEGLAHIQSENLPSLLRSLTKNAIDRVRAAARHAFAQPASADRSKKDDYASAGKRGDADE